MKLALILLALVTLAANAAQLKLTTLRASIDPYPLDQFPQGSNAVIVVYKSTSLGTTWTPFKPTAIFPAGRSNQSIQVLAPGTYRFYATCQMQAYGDTYQSDPSSPLVTNIVTLTSATMVQATAPSTVLFKAAGPSRWNTAIQSKVGHRDFFDRNRNRN